MRESHGHKREGHISPEYRTWLGIKRRCFDPKCKDYPKYGARGIIVSAGWNRSFLTFLSDMGPKPTPNHQIDRMNPNGNYERENCRWVTPTIQGQENRRDMIPVIVQGMQFISINAAARFFGINVTTVHYRLKSGVPLDEAFVKREKRMTSRRPRESYLKKSHPDRAAESHPTSPNV